MYNDSIKYFEEKFDVSNNFLQSILTFYENTKSFIDIVEPYFYNGYYEISYNRYNDKPFERGKMYLCTSGISFVNAVNFLKNTKYYYNINFTFDDAMALYCYCYKLNDSNNPIVKNTFELYCGIYSNVNNLSSEYFIDLINIAKKNMDKTIEDGRLSWYNTITNAKKEIYYKCLDIITEVANKYDLDKEIFEFACGYLPQYPKDTIIPKMPEKYNNRFKD